MANKFPQQVTKEAQTKVSETLNVFYDAQLAMQKNAFDTARATFEGSLALQRSALRVMTKAMESGMTTVVVPAPEQVAAQFRAYAVALPGMTPEGADKMSKDVAATFTQARDATGKQVQAMREAATRAAQQYEQFLAQVEAQSHEGFKAAAASTENATKVATQVSGEWVDAMFEAVNAAVKAAEETQATVASTVEKTAKTN